MFLQLCVILFMGGGGLCIKSLPVWLPGALFLLGVSVPSPMLFLRVSGQGVSVWGRGFLSRGLCLRSLCLGRGSLRLVYLIAVTSADGMHPTGMHSCFTKTILTRGDERLGGRLSPEKHFQISGTAARTHHYRQANLKAVPHQYLKIIKKL